MQKGVSPLIAMVFVVLISVTAIGIVMTTGAPLLGRLSDSATVSQAEKNMILIDDVTMQAASEGFGISKRAKIDVSDGIYRVDRSLNETAFNLTLKSDLLPKMNMTSGNMIRTVEGSGSNTELQMRMHHDNIKVVGDLRIGRGTHEVCFRKAGQEGKKIIINVTAC